MESTEACRTGHPGDHMYCYLTKKARANTEGARSLVCDVAARFMISIHFYIAVFGIQQWGVPWPQNVDRKSCVFYSNVLVCGGQ
jgi:hypothetical protein